MSASDKKTMGLSTENRDIVARMMDGPYFRDLLDAARFGLAVAIQAGVQPGQAEGADTIWNVGSFDPDGEIRALITSLYPEIDTPYRVAEFLVNEGLSIVGQRLDKVGYFDPTDIVTLPSAPA